MKAGLIYGLVHGGWWSLGCAWRHAVQEGLLGGEPELDSAFPSVRDFDLSKLMLQ